MASGFPGSIDNFTDPLTTSALNSPSHAGQHQDLNDAVEKIETYMGLVKVIPTSVSSAGGTAATLNATTGNVTVGTGNTSVTVTCFSSLYDNYLVTYTGGTMSALALIGIYLGTAPAASGYYGAKTLSNVSGTFIGGGDNNVGQWQNANAGTTTIADCNFSLFGPFASRATYISSTYWELNAGSSVFGTYQGVLANTTSYTQFTIDPQSANTLTGGTIRVYGYRN